MARLAFVCLPFHGHIAPLAAIGQELARRGHDVTFFHHPELGPRIESFGLDFVPLQTREPKENWYEPALARAAKVRGWLGMRAVIKDFAYCSLLLGEALPAAIRERSIDAIVGDWLEPACGVVAYHLGLPYVSVAAALPMNWEPGDATPLMAWRYSTGRLYRAAAQSVQWGAERVQGPIHDAIRGYIEAWDLPRHRRIQDWASGYAQIAQLVPSLDQARQTLTGCFHYCGPLRSSSKTASGRGGGAGRRRAFASLGSMKGHRIDVFERIVEAAETLDLDLTLAHGGLLSSSEAERLSKRATVHAFVDYADVLAESDIAIMHGGMNGVLDALAHGVPLVTVPLAFEQGAIAERVRRTGAGVVCRARSRGRRLADAIATVLDDPSYAAAAARVRDEIRDAGGTPRAADIVEQVVRTRQPCLNRSAVAAEPALASLALGAA